MLGVSGWSIVGTSPSNLNIIYNKYELYLSEP